MFWIVLVPTAWMVISALLGVLIGQCIRDDRSEEADGTTAGAPPVQAAAPLPSGELAA